MSGPSLFQLSYALLWLLALVLIPISVVLLYLLAQLQAQSGQVFPGSRPSEARLIGRTMPGLSVKDPASGTTRAIHEFRGSRHAVLALSPNCGSCLELLNELKTASSRDFEDASVLLLCMGDLEHCRTAMAEVHAVPVHVLDKRDAASTDLWLTGTPAAYIVDETGVIVDVQRPSTLKSLVMAIGTAKQSVGDGASKSGHVVALGGRPVG